MAGECSDVSNRSPSTWQTETLAKLVTAIRNGTTATQNQSGIGLPVTRIETISDGSIDYSKVRHLDAHPQDIDLYRLRTGDVLLSHINSVKHIGKVARYGGEYPLIHGMNLIRIIFDEQRIDPLLGYYILSSIRAKRYFERRAKKAINQASLNRKDIGALPVYLPPFPEQHKIAAILSSVDNAIEKTRAVIDQTQVVKRGLMQELFTQGLPRRHTRFKQTEMGEIPEGWSLKSIAEIGKVVTGSTPNTSNQAFWNGTIPFVTPADLGKTKRVSITNRSVSEEGLAQVKEIPPNAVMITCIGSIGKLGIATERCCTNQQINSIIPGSSVLSEYLHYALSLTSRTLVGLAGITAVPIVSKSRFLTLRVPVPCLAEQEQIAGVLSGVDHLVEINQARLTLLTEAKFGLISILLTGELRVTPDPEAP